MNMDVIVADSSTVIKWFLDEIWMAEARLLREQYKQGLVRLAAPSLIYAEIGNVLWKNEIHRGLSPEDAEAAMTAFRATPLEITPIEPLLEEAYRLAVTHRRSVYDPLYLALSRREGCRFVTADEKLVNAVKAAFPNIVHIADWK
jgi:predicted nucleic acid-binding protein